MNWLSFLNKYKLHGILCDDMGLGKTLQSICILAGDHFLRYPCACHCVWHLWTRSTKIRTIGPHRYYRYLPHYCSHCYPALVVCFWVIDLCVCVCVLGVLLQREQLSFQHTSAGCLRIGCLCWHHTLSPGDQLLQCVCVSACACVCILLCVCILVCVCVYTCVCVSVYRNCPCFCVHMCLCVWCV